MFLKRDKGGLPEARLVGRSAKRAPKAPTPVGSAGDDGESDAGDELASLMPMLFFIGLIVLILWGAAS